MFDAGGGASRTRFVARSLLLVAAANVMVSCASGGSSPVEEGRQPFPPDSELRSEVTVATTADAIRDDSDEATATRDPVQWPYPWDSIWNHPLGDQARLVDFEMTIPTERTLNVEEDIIITEPDAPTVTIHAHDAAWEDGVTRCGSQTGDAVADGLPIPSGWVTDPHYHGRKPNHAAAILLPDMTLFETQPFHICEDGTAVSQYHNEHWRGDSILTGGQGGEHGGSHGGSYMTAFGGTIRLGEWVPDGEIRHVMKMTVYSPENVSASGRGYRWPALRPDRGWETRYGGSVPAANMGALVALPPDFDISLLTSEPARIVATTLQRYGAYIVDGSGWSTAAFATEWGPNGRVTEEFESAWGFPLAGDVRSPVNDAQEEFLTDIELIYGSLHVVDDNGPDTPGGAGRRLAPWAPPFHDSTGGHPEN